MRMMMVPIGVCVQSGGGGDGCGTEEIGVGWLFARTVIVDMIVFFCLLEWLNHIWLNGYVWLVAMVKVLSLELSQKVVEVCALEFFFFYINHKYN